MSRFMPTTVDAAGRRPRVLLLNDRGDISGAEHTLLGLLEAMGTRDRAGVAVACPGEGPLRERVEALGVPWYPSVWFTPGVRRSPATLPGLALGGARAAMEVARVVRASGAAVVHANSVRAGALAGAAAPLHRRPVIVHVRDCVTTAPLGQVVRRTVQFGAAAVVANSRYAAAHFSGGSALADKTAVVYNGVDLRRFSIESVPSAAVAAARRDLLGSSGESPAPGGEFAGGSAPVVAVVGQITPWKGQAEAIRAFALVRKAYPGARLLLVGGAKFTTATSRYDNRAYLASLHALVRDLDLGASVVFAGERADIPAVLALADVVLVPSWEEPFGRVVVESMAMRRPVVATDAGGPAEIITPGETGLLVPPKLPEALAAAALSILWSPDHGRAMGERARQAARSRFSVEAHASTVLALWQAVVAGVPAREIAGRIGAEAWAGTRGIRGISSNSQRAVPVVAGPLGAAATAGVSAHGRFDD
jgi:glycosyltransferase involved in cell wall biosynthesis